MNGSLPKRLALAGTFCTATLNRPGRVNSPAPFLSTEASTELSRPASTALTDLASTPVFSTR
ncbi:Uncharacterised protein [Bordetella pertussis]|nr:Uncharacterised protein [Bordetella pertussis]